MIIVMKPTATEENIQSVVSHLTNLGLSAHLSRGEEITIIGAVGDKSRLTDANTAMLPGVEKLVPVSESYKLANKKFKQATSTIKVKDVEIGGDKIVIMGGPCAVESKEQLFSAAKAVKAGGAQILRGGAYKPRTSPYSFQGLEEEGLIYMKEAGEAMGLLIVCEITSPHSADVASKYVDILQIGSRNMQNFELLKEVGKIGIPVLLKRGLASTVDEWLNAAEYIMSSGNYNVILCERGIRTFETATRFTLDLSAVPLLKQKTHLPLIVDPSHATGIRELVPPMAKASICAGADGLMIEVHPDPKNALSDGPQSLDPDEFKTLCNQLKPLCSYMGREF